MPKAQNDGEKAMERLREVRSALVELVGEFGWFPYGRFTRCTRPGYMCPRCKDSPERGAHGPYVGLVRCHENSRAKDRINLGALQEENGKLILTGRGLPPTPLTLAGLRAINRLYRHGAIPTKAQIIGLLQNGDGQEAIAAMVAISQETARKNLSGNSMLPEPASLEDVVV